MPGSKVRWVGFLFCLICWWVDLVLVIVGARNFCFGVCEGSSWRRCSPCLVLSVCRMEDDLAEVRDEVEMMDEEEGSIGPSKNAKKKVSNRHELTLGLVLKAPTPWLKGARIVSVEYHTMSGGYPHRVWREPTSCLEGTHTVSGGCPERVSAVPCSEFPHRVSGASRSLFPGVRIMCFQESSQHA